MAIDKRLLDILCCPFSHQALLPLDAVRLNALNSAITRGGIKQNDGSPINERISEALVTADGKRVYRIDDSIPILLIEASVAMEQVGHAEANG